MRWCDLERAGMKEKGVKKRGLRCGRGGQMEREGTGRRYEGRECEEEDLGI